MRSKAGRATGKVVVPVAAQAQEAGGTGEREAAAGDARRPVDRIDAPDAGVSRVLSARALRRKADLQVVERRRSRTRDDVRGLEIQQSCFPMPPDQRLSLIHISEPTRQP